MISPVIGAISSTILLDPSELETVILTALSSWLPLASMGAPSESKPKPVAAPVGVTDVMRVDWKTLLELSGPKLEKLSEPPVERGTKLAVPPVAE